MAEHDIQIKKAGKSGMIHVDDFSFDEATLVQLIKLGIESALNSRMSKVGAVTKLEGSELASAQAAAMKIANENLEALRTGKFKFPGAKAKSAEPREVMNEAVRLAREVVRDQIRAAGYAISHVPAKDITEAAKRRVAADDTYITQAKANLEARKAVPTEVIDLEALGIHVDQAKVEKSKLAKAARDERAKTLSKTQAGKTAKRVKPKADLADVMAAAGNPGKAPHGHPVH